MKKIIAGMSIFGVAALGFGALAEGWVPSGDTHNDADVTIVNGAVILTDASSDANTGKNDANADSDARNGSSRAKGGMNVTGDADATTVVAVAANQNDVLVDQSGCGCAKDGDVWNEADVKAFNFAFIGTRARSDADTGKNDADAESETGGHHSTGGSSRARGGMNMTGNASARTEVGAVANLNMFTVLQ